MKNKEDSEDIVQAVFSKIYSLPKDKFPIDNIATWIYSVTKNEQEDSQTKTESVTQDSTKSVNTPEQNAEKNIANNINETKEEIQVPVNEPATNINNYSIGIFSVSSVFLILTIIIL